MLLPLQVTFRDMPHSAAAEREIRSRVDQLGRYYPSIVGCRVVLERHHKHRHHGRLFHLRIDLTVPGGELVVSHESHDAHQHEDPYVAIRDGFRAARRRLEDFARKQRREVKTHVVPTHGRVTALFADEGYGFIQSPGHEGDVYFSAHAAVGGLFAKLQVGDEVRFELHDDESVRGPQASSVRRVGKHHLAEPRA